MNSFFSFASRHNLAIHIVLILVLGLSIRLAYWQDARAYAIGADEIDYVLPAQTLVRDGRYVDTFVTNNRMWTRVPLTQLLFAFSFLFVPDQAATHAEGDDAALMQPRYDALNIAQIVVSLFTILLIMLLAERSFGARGRRAGIIAGYIAAIYPPLASSPAQRALSEPLALAVILAGMAALSYWSPEMPRRRALVVAAVAGAIFGVGALARSVALAFLPFVWIWLFIVWRAHTRKSSQVTGSQPEPAPAQARAGIVAPNFSRPRRAILAFSPAGRFRTYRHPLITAVVATFAFFLAIAPWTYYNYRTYNTFLLLETANATAYWNYHNYRHENYEARLQALPNPADRLSLIIKEGTANILEYPDQALRTTIFSTFYFWHLESNSAVLLNPWDMTQRDPDPPDLLHSDLIFFLVGLTGMAGFAGVAWRSPTDLAGRTLLLVDLWLIGMILLGMVVPYDGRYRLPAAPAVIILAAGLLATANWRAVFSPRRAWAIVRRHMWVTAAAVVLCAWVVAGAYSANIPSFLRSLYEAWRGDIALHMGDTSGAFGRYELAQKAFPTFYWPVRHEADQARLLGKDDQARTLYDRSLQLDVDDPYGMLGLADLVAHHPEWTLTKEERSELGRDEVDWRGNPWNSVALTPIASVEVGSPGDIAYIRGFYKPDQSPGLTYRWSMGRSTIRIPMPSGSYSEVKLRLSAPALGSSKPLPISISVNGAAPLTLNVSVGWADYTLKAPQSAGTITLDLLSPTLTPSVVQKGNPDNRHLGVGVDRVTLVPAP